MTAETKEVRVALRVTLDKGWRRGEWRARCGAHEAVGKKAEVARAAAELAARAAERDDQRLVAVFYAPGGVLVVWTAADGRARVSAFEARPPGSTSGCKRDCGEFDDSADAVAEAARIAGDPELSRRAGVGATGEAAAGDLLRSVAGTVGVCDAGDLATVARRLRIKLAGMLPAATSSAVAPPADTGSPEAVALATLLGLRPGDPRVRAEAEAVLAAAPGERWSSRLDGLRAGGSLLADLDRAVDENGRAEDRAERVAELEPLEDMELHFASDDDLESHVANMRWPEGSAICVEVARRIADGELVGEAAEALSQHLPDLEPVEDLSTLADAIERGALFVRPRAAGED